MMDEEKISLTDREGAIVLRDESPPEIYAPLCVGESCDNIRFTLAFILYAVEREDWIMEFGEFVDKLQEKKNDNSSAEIRRSNFKIIEGEKK
tara:strand:+ start:1538 stop:1813 length:276 start_codon:yes stop_codon:yes gene_type:complete